LNLLCLQLLSTVSTESETEHHAARNMVDWSALVIESIFGYLEVVHVKCDLNASWPYWETLDNDVVHVKSAAVCRARRLQGDHVAYRLSTISTRPREWMTAEHTATMLWNDELLAAGWMKMLTSA